MSSEKTCRHHFEANGEESSAKICNDENEKDVEMYAKPNGKVLNTHHKQWCNAHNDDRYLYKCTNETETTFKI